MTSADTSSPSLVARYDRPAPRYTSYPSAAMFHDGVSATDYLAALERADVVARGPWSLYVHVPFCRERCSFCACSVIATPRADKVTTPYLDHLEREIALVAERLGQRRRVGQLHWGGGTPTYLSPDEIERLAAAIYDHFTLDDDAEVSVEVDPRVTTRAHLEALRRAGFHRISLGVQDVDDEVQAAIGRHQTWDQTKGLLETARELGFINTNIDLVYGLPGQTRDSFARTLESVFSLRPERFAVYGYAHMPQIRSNQRSIDPALLPEAALRLQLATWCREQFVAAGYKAIGLDHFVVADDELAIASEQGRLHRNFMGYTVIPSQDMLGFGVTAIGDLPGAFIQNTKKLSTYYEALHRSELPVERGYLRSRDDELRRYVIMQLMCARQVARGDVRQRFGVEDFDGYFDLAKGELAQMKADGLVTDDGDRIAITEAGHPFLRTIATCFDAYVRTAPAAKPLSSAV